MQTREPALNWAIPTKYSAGSLVYNSLRAFKKKMINYVSTALLSNSATVTRNILQVTISQGM